MSTGTATAPEQKRKGLSFTTDEVQAAAAKYGKRQEAAHSLGYSGEFAHVSFGKFLREHPDHLEAWNAGLKQYRLANAGVDLPARKAEPSTVMSDDSGLKPSKSRAIDYKAVEEAAATLVTMREIQTATGFSGPSGFYGRIKTDPGFKAAIDRGKARNPNVNGDAPKATRQVPKPRAAKPTAPANEMIQSATQLAEEVIVEAPATDLTMSSEAAQELIDDMQHAYDEKLLDGQKNGFKPVEEMVPPFEGAIEKFGDTDLVEFEGRAAGDDPFLEKADDIETIIDVASEMLDAAMESRHRPASITQLTFEKGGQLSLAFAGNFFDLTQRERTMLIALTEQFQKYPQTVEQVILTSVMSERKRELVEERPVHPKRSWFASLVAILNRQ